MNYSREFYRYLIELSKKKSNYGGGSAVCFVFCIGISLLEKALVFSSIDKDKFKLLKKLRKKILPFIDMDGKLFNLAIKSKGKERVYLFNKIQKIIITTGLSCYNIFNLLEKIRPNIKDSIKSDFYIGLSLVKLALKGCIYNLEANEELFKKRSKYIDIFKDYEKYFKCD